MTESIVTAKKNINRKFHKATFENTSQERRAKIFKVAIEEFASNGYNGANINNIAKKAGISIGSLYSYFASKEDLFLAIVDNIYELLASVIADIDPHKSIFIFIENLLKAARDYAIKWPEINQIYIDLTTQSVARFSGPLSHKLEEITSILYMKAIKSAKKNGEIREDIDDNVLAFLIDNMVSMYQFSFSSDYYKERIKIYLNTNNMEDDKVISHIVEVIKQGIKK